jgi:hypothetical protein
MSKLCCRLTLGLFLICVGCGASDRSERSSPVLPLLDVGDRAHEAATEAKPESESERTPYDLPQLPGVPDTEL